MATQILLKRSSGSSFDISTCTTVLAAGEAFVDLTTKKLYVGDGSTQLKDLSPVNISSLTLSDIGGTDDLRVIEALTGQGFLKRTGDNTWALDSLSSVDKSTVSGNGIWRFTHSKSGTIHTITIEDPKFSDYLEANKVYMIFGTFTSSFTSGDTITLQKMVSGTATTIASGITLKSTTGQNAVSNSFVSGSCSLMILSMGNSTSSIAGLFIQPAVSVWAS